MNAQGARSPSHGGSAGTEGRGTDGEGRCTDHSVGSARHGSGRAGEAGKAKDAVKGSAKGLHCKKESMKKVPNGKSELELQELDPKKVRRILANRQVRGFEWIRHKGGIGCRVLLCCAPCHFQRSVQRGPQGWIRPQWASVYSSGLRALAGT